MSGSPLAIDIETVGLDWDELDPTVRAYLLGRAKNDEERESVPERLSLHPGTGRIIAIGLWRPFQQRGGVLIEGIGNRWEQYPVEDGEGSIFFGTEAQLLTEFWRIVSSADSGQIITYNGRSFDGPFLMLRSTVLGIEPTRNLVPNRYHLRDHCDLADVLSFFRARPYDSFDFWCRSLGVGSPKEGIDGSMVGQLYRDGKLDEIARYCLNDAMAACRLYQRILPLLRVMGGDWTPRGTDPGA